MLKQISSVLWPACQEPPEQLESSTLSRDTGSMDRRDRRIHAPVAGKPRSSPETGASGEAASAWTLFATLGGLKLVLVLTIVALYPTHEAVLVQAVTSWPWLVVPAIFLAAPALFWYRRLRARVRRKHLLEAEWRAD